MTKFSAPSPLRAADYEAIEAALLESARGRWFLAEFSSRNRSADTQMLLEAITKLEASVMRPNQESGQDRIRHELIEMSEAISRTRAEIAAISSSNDENQLITATEELDAIVEATEKATSDILEAAEDVQETAWVLREKGVEDATCDRLDQRATDIYTACSFQDITGQRTGKVVGVLRYLEERVNGLVNAWGLEDLEVHLEPRADDRPDAHLLNGPQLAGKGLEQEAVDDMINVVDSDFEFVEDPASNTADAVAAPATDIQPPPPPAPQAPPPEAPSPAASAPPPQQQTQAEPAASKPETAKTPPPGTIVAKVNMVPAPAAPETVQAPATAQSAIQDGVVSAREFSAPGGLELGSLGPAKTGALFS